MTARSRLSWTDDRSKPFRYEFIDDRGTSCGKPDRDFDLIWNDREMGHRETDKVLHRPNDTPNPTERERRKILARFGRKGQ